ncbi:hypothetical protein SLS53_002536 [Cytospora paraplurivora]|uniref:BTB domain-containing protein n=1 Tax=Cytospora paraplurivora TaxID=2898453 RepID=A0AAN9YK24_9PEZI
MSQGPEQISEALTVIITTSPTPSAPSPELLESILDSFQNLCPALLSCKVVVVFDTFDRIAAENRLKKGSVTAEGAASFPAYKENVKKLILQQFAGRGPEVDTPMVEEEGEAEFGSPCMPGNSTSFSVRRTEDRRVIFIEPSERLGFGLAVRSALRLVETPYVWVQQHDWILQASIPVQSILEVMMESGEDAPVKYVCLPSPRMLGYAESPHVQSFPGLRRLSSSLKRDFTSSEGRIPLTPLFFWHDKTHIASTEHYLSSVFSSRLAMPRGAFIEDHIGQRARNQMKEGLLASGEGADATVICINQTWRVHKAILCHRSEWFRIALMGEFQEARSSRVTITEWRENEVDLLLHWIYTGVVDVDKYLANMTPLMAQVKVWQIADFFCLPGLTRAALAARDRLLQTWTKHYSTNHQDLAHLGDDHVVSVVQDLRALYKLSIDMKVIRETFLLPYLAVLLLGTRFFAQTEAFKMLILEEPEFAQDWALGLMRGVGSTIMPLDARQCNPFCEVCGQHVTTPTGNYPVWAQERRVAVFCPDCLPTPTWEDWTGTT